MMTSFAQYPYAALQSVGTNLFGISEEVRSSSKGAAEVLGLDADQAEINGALCGFRDEWEASVEKLGENIGNFGQLSLTIGQMAGDLDAELGKAMAPGGSGAGGGGQQAV